MRRVLTNSIPEMLVVSLLSAGEEERALALRRLTARLGPAVFFSEPLDFPSGYYESEMGGPLSRRLAGFQRLAAPDRLAAIKRVCMSLENDLAPGGKRRVNLDPGLLGTGSLVLATRKAMGHRICLEPGIFAEVTLWFAGGGYHPLPWTYRDYSGAELGSMLKHLRLRYLWMLKRNGAEVKLND